jgi:phosphatidylinositol kinase/protein kinase (PI-3  family)
MPCFEHGDINITINKFRERFHERKSEVECIKVINEIINSSNNNFWTNKYDLYQRLTNGILP